MKNKKQSILSLLRSCSITSVVMACVITSSVANADILDNMTDFAQELGGSATGTSAASYESQGYRYYTGGNLYMNVPNQSYEAFSIQAPNFKTSGCGAIDMTLGGFSLISGDQLVNAMKQTAENAAAYAFSLALRSISPKIMTTIGEIQDKMQKFNGMQMNTCEMGKTAVNSLASQKWTTEEDNLCIDTKMSRDGSSYSEAVDACKGDRNAVNASPEARDISRRKGMFVAGNLGWVIMEEKCIAGCAARGAVDQQLRELFLSITGTRIKLKTDTSGASTPEGDNNAATMGLDKPSLFNENPDAYIKYLLEGHTTGSTVEIYQCGLISDADLTSIDPKKRTEMCLGMTKVLATSLGSFSGFLGLVRTRLDSLYAAALDMNVSITDEDKVFLNSTSLPVYKIVNISASLSNGGTSSSPLLNKYSELIAIDWMMTYLRQMTSSLQATIVDDRYQNDKKAMLLNMQVAMQYVQNTETKISRKVNEQLEIMKELQFYERVISTSMPDMYSTQNDWARGQQ